MSEQQQDDVDREVPSYWVQALELVPVLLLITLAIVLMLEGANHVF